MSTWKMMISLPTEFKDWTVLCTGETEAETFIEDDFISHVFSHRSFVLPMSTFAIAIGHWTIKPLPTDDGPVVRFIGHERIINNNIGDMFRYVPTSLSVAQRYLGDYPLPRLDIVIVHRSFSGLGLASPHLLFLSPRLKILF